MENKLKQFRSNIVIEYLPMLLILAVLIFIVFITTNKTEKQQANTSLFEKDFVEYQDFQENIWSIYPYYEPDGVTYKNNLYNLLESKEAEARTLYEKLATMSSASDDIPGIRDGVKNELKNLNLVWVSYRDSACYLREDIWQGGSGSSGFLLMCQLYETQKYIDLLKKYEDDFL